MKVVPLIAVALILCIAISGGAKHFLGRAAAPRDLHQRSDINGGPGPRFLTSPNYPNNYGNNIHMIQPLSVENGTSIHVKFHDFQIEFQSWCTYDYVQFCYGNGICGDKMCGKTLPPDLTIETSTATVLFHSDYSVTPKGFKLSYQAVQATAEKVLTSPYYPNNYGNNIDVSKTFSVENGSSIQVTFQDFQIEYHSRCAYDYVQLCDGNGICGDRMCGKSLSQDPITIETSTATVLFHSDHSITLKGFKASYQAAAFKTTTTTTTTTTTVSQSQGVCGGGRKWFLGTCRYPYTLEDCPYSDHYPEECPGFGNSHLCEDGGEIMEIMETQCAKTCLCIAIHFTAAPTVPPTWCFWFFSCGYTCNGSNFRCYIWNNVCKNIVEAACYNTT